jgi:hypothetical protein
MKLVQQELASERDHLDDVGVCPPRLPDRRKLGVGNFAARLDERFREGDRSLALGIARAAFPVQRDFVGRDLTSPILEGVC